jgi:DNA mismatch repair protein MutS2
VRKTFEKRLLPGLRDEAQQLLKESNRMIESTIRQIKETQAEKEKTKDIRLQLEEFKNAVTEDTKPLETESEEKIAILSSKAKKIKLEPEPPARK